jgi:hypothetical protein
MKMGLGIFLQRPPRPAAEAAGLREINDEAVERVMRGGFERRQCAVEWGFEVSVNRRLAQASRYRTVGQT